MSELEFPEKPAGKIAVAVSGGADSMALVHALARTGKKILALTVDHGLRPESAAEGRQVARWLGKFRNVTHAVIKLDVPKPESGLMEWARDARYKAMAEACRKARIKYLAVAHHADDQAETFFMRLSHGSGLDGLSGMKTFQPYNEKLLIYRPFLACTHADLVNFCKKNKIRWIEDPSNKNDSFTRPRLRKALALEGLDARRLAVTQARLARASDALRSIAAMADDTARLNESPLLCSYDFKKLTSWPDEIFLRVLRGAVEKLGKGGYGPRLDRLEEMATSLKSATAKTRMTLGGCILEADPGKNRLNIYREQA